MTDLNIGGVVKRTKIYGQDGEAPFGYRLYACLQGCWNKELWPTKGGTFYTHEELCQNWSATDCEGVTFLRRPLQQAEVFVAFAQGFEPLARVFSSIQVANRDELDETQLACVEQADMLSLVHIQELKYKSSMARLIKLLNS